MKRSPFSPISAPLWISLSLFLSSVIIPCKYRQVDVAYSTTLVRLSLYCIAVDRPLTSRRKSCVLTLRCFFVYFPLSSLSVRLLNACAIKLAVVVQLVACSLSVLAAGARFAVLRNFYVCNGFGGRGILLFWALCIFCFTSCIRMREQVWFGVTVIVCKQFGSFDCFFREISKCKTSRNKKNTAYKAIIDRVIKKNRLIGNRTLAARACRQTRYQQNWQRKCAYFYGPYELAVRKMENKIVY
jgi:hypothetical protein